MTQLVVGAVILKAPFPWFGGKSRVAHVVWERFGVDVANYVEPFAGSLAVLLGRPGEARHETVNDRDAYLANFWRALQHDPEEVARWADWPVNEADLHARHRWLVDQADFRERMLTDPEFFDARIAGWWVWGISQWIGSGWCVAPEWRGRFGGPAPRGVHRKRVDIRKGGRGVHSTPGRRRPNLKGNGVVVRRIARQIPDLSGDSGASGRGVHQRSKDLVGWMEALAARLRRVRVCCGDWSRILGPSPTTSIGTTAVLLDPPYGEGAGRDRSIYSVDAEGLAARAREWALEHGSNPELRIALCGYEGEHEMPGWDEVAWKANGGYGNRSGGGRGRENATRERVWFSPHCLAGRQAQLFEAPA